MLTILTKIKKKLFEEKEDEMNDSYDYVIQPSETMRQWNNSIRSDLKI